MRAFFDINKAATKLELAARAVDDPAKLKQTMLEVSEDLNALNERLSGQWGDLAAAIKAMEKG